MKNTDHSSSASSPARPWLFLGLALGLTWLFELAAVALQHALPRAAVYGIAYTGSAMVFIVAAVMVQFNHDRPFRRDFWLRLVDVRRISPAWFVVIFLFQPVIATTAAWIDRLTGGAGMSFELLSSFLTNPLMVVPTVLWWLVFGPLAEEPGWRGYAQDGLQARYSPLASALIVGVFWALWHIPLSFLEGTWQAAHQAPGTAQFWLYLVNIVMTSVLTAWVYNHTNRSILAAVLLHFTTNAFGEMYALSPRAEMFNLAIFWAAVLIIAAVWSRQPRQAESAPAVLKDTQYSL